MEFVYFMRAIGSLLLAGILIVTGIGYPRLPHEREMELVWSDEFDGDALDRTKWDGHYIPDGESVVRRGSYWDMRMITVRDGAMHIATRYYPDGLEGNGKPGWYTAAVHTAGLYYQRYGYFETRCILPKGSGMWAAFWLLCGGMSNVDGTGIDGAEIDIFEAPFWSQRMKRRVSCNVHIDGYGEDLKSKNVCEGYIFNNDPYEEYNTYGLLWNEKEYIFYINGVCIGRTDFGGTSQVPEFLILSVEIGGENAVPGDSWSGAGLTPDSETSDFIVDYVRCYQYKQNLG